MNQENKRCGTCVYYKAYYTQGYCCLLKENNGYCSLHAKITERTDSCDKWFCRYTSKQKRLRIALTSMSEIYKKISVIEQILSNEVELKRLREQKDDAE